MYVNYISLLCRTSAALVAKSTGCKGTYSLMRLPGHDRVRQTVPDAMHTIKDVVEKIVHLISGEIYVHEPAA